jgi:hypothetical protein
LLFGFLHVDFCGIPAGKIEGFDIPYFLLHDMYLSGYAILCVFQRNYSINGQLDVHIICK